MTHHVSLTCRHFAITRSYFYKVTIQGRLHSLVVIVNDNGSENYKTRGITQYFARPYTPKDKPHVENLIGKLQQVDEYRGHYTLEEWGQQVITWLNDYHFFRPHQALRYLTPNEFCATLGISILRRQVSMM